MSHISTLSEIIFTGISIFTPILVLLKFNRSFDNRLNINILVSATNWLLFFAGVIYLVVWASIFAPGYITNYYLQNEFEQYAFVGRIFGPYWFAYIGYLIINGVLPQFLWFKKCRQSIVPTIIWVIVDYALTAKMFYIKYYARDFIPASPPQYLFILLSCLFALIVFLLLLSIVYFILITQQKRSLSKH